MSGAAAEAPEETAESLDFGGWKPTGRKTAGPDSELVEVENPDGHKQTAIVYDRTWREHHRLTTDVELVQSFMEFPMVEGLACLSRAPAGQGLFQYDTGSVLALVEVLRGYRDQRKKVGQKAAYELLVAVTHMLQEASENGPMHGIYSHGGITPWRVVLDADGDPSLIGYGLPQMDMVALREDETLRVRDDSYKYCPPERITSGYEDISTDIYAMVLIAHEMILGESLLKGNAKELKSAVELGKAQGLMQSAKGIDKKLKEVFVKALAFDPIGRFEEPHEFLDALQTAAGGRDFKGDSLEAVMANVRSTTRRGKALMDVGTAGGPRRASLGERKTRMKSAGAARPVRGRGPAARSQDVNVSSDGRWGKVRRSAEEEAEEAASRSVAGRPSRRRRGAAEESGATSSVASRPSRRRRGKGDDDEEEKSSVAARPSRRRRGASEDDDAPAATRPSRRRRGSSDADEDEDKPAATRPSRRRRGGSDAADEDEDKPAATRPSRRRRGSSDDAEEAAEAEETRARPSRRRRGATAEGEADEAKVEEAQEDKPTRSRRSRRSKAADEDEKPEAKAEVKADEASEAKAEDKPTRSRRSRSRTKAADEDEKPAEKAEEAPSEEAGKEEEPAKPTRSRRSRRTKASDEGEKPAEKAEEESGDSEEEAKPSRSRRTRSSARTSAAASGARRSLRSSRARTRASDDEDETSEDKPTRSRRSRSRTTAKDDDAKATAADDAEDAPKAKKPSRSRRSRRSKKDE